MNARGTVLGCPHTDALKPSTLGELLRIPPGEVGGVDVARMNLLCSAGLPGAEQVDIAAYLSTLDVWARDVAHATEASRHLLDDHPDILQNSEPLWQMYCLTRVLWQRHRVRYCPEEIDRSKDADWSMANRHMLYGLIGPERIGTCASLPVLLVAVARRLGYPMKLVHSPGHVFCRWDGLDDPKPAWREPRNIEFAGDFDSYPDERYYECPVKWSADTFEMERLRQPMPLFLRSLTPAEELASFLVQRGHALEAHEMFADAMAAYCAAIQFAPHNDCYVFFSKQCSQRQLDRLLAPWGLNAQQYCRIVERRLTGTRIPFPWETSDGKPIPNANPFCDPTAGAVLMAAQQAVIARLAGVRPQSKAMQYVLRPNLAASRLPAPQEPCLKDESVDDVFSDEVSELFVT